MCLKDAYFSTLNLSHLFQEALSCCLCLDLTLLCFVSLELNLLPAFSVWNPHRTHPLDKC